MAQALARPGKLTFPGTKNRWGSQGLKEGGGQLGTLLPPPPTALGPGRMVTATSSEGRVLSELPNRQLQTVGTPLRTGEAVQRPGCRVGPTGKEQPLLFQFPHHQ